jgi:hypothetical protein
MMGRLSLRHALAAAFVAAFVLLPAGALAARPVEQFHEHFTDTFSDELCGIPVDGVVVVTDNFFVYADDSFKATNSVKATFTNPETGKSVVLFNAGQVTGTAVVDEQAGTITFFTTFKGLPEKIQTAHGPVLLRDAGVITFVETLDLETGDLISSDVVIKGPHPEAESDFELFCEVMTDALT